jgi:hypothetical protein
LALLSEKLSHVEKKIQAAARVCAIFHIFFYSFCPQVLLTTFAPMVTVTPAFYLYVIIARLRNCALKPQDAYTAV